MAIISALFKQVAQLSQRDRTTP